MKKLIYNDITIGAIDFPENKRVSTTRFFNFSDINMFVAFDGDTFLVLRANECCLIDHGQYLLKSLSIKDIVITHKEYIQSKKRCRKKDKTKCEKHIIFREWRYEVNILLNTTNDLE
jgi:hypothetical protein